MNNRQLLILEILTASVKPIKGREFAEKLEVSERTIRNDIAFIKDELEKIDLNIISTRNGYHIEKDSLPKVSSYLYKAQKLDMQKVDIPNSPDERKLFELFKICFSKRPIPMELLAQELFVSKTTVYLDIKDLSEMIPEIIANQYGVSVNASEDEIRNILFDYVYEEEINDIIFPNSFYFVFSNSYNRRDIDLMILSIYEMLIKHLHESRKLISDIDLTELVRKLLIIKLRNDFDFELSSKSELNLDENWISNIIQDLVINDYIKDNNSEKEFVRNLILPLKAVTSRSDVGILTNKSREIVELFVSEVLTRYHIDFTLEDGFVENLSMHVDLMVERLKVGTSSEVGMSHQIKSMYPFAFEIASVLIPIIKSTLGETINEAEIAYVALHVGLALRDSHTPIKIAIVCGSGMNSARLLMRRLEKYFGEYIRIIEVYSYYQLQREKMKDLHEIDLIISTIPIDFDKVPSIHVNVLLHKNDIDKIQNIIDEHYANKSTFEHIDIFDEALFKSFDTSITFNQCLVELTELLNKENALIDGEKFLKSVFERESIYSTILDTKIALPHPLEIYAKRTAVAIGVYNQPDKVDKVKVVLLLAIDREFEPYLSDFYGLIESIVGDDEFIHTLSQSNNYKEFMQSLEKRGLIRRQKINE